MQGNEASDNRTRSFYREQVNLMLRYGYLQKQGKPVQGHVSSHMFIQLVATAAGLDSILPELEMDLQPLVTLTAPNARITIKLMVGEAKLTYTKGMLLTPQALHLTKAMSAWFIKCSLAFLHTSCLEQTCLQVM